MSGLVGYGSSDEDDEEVLTERPAKVAKTNGAFSGEATNQKSPTVPQYPTVQQAPASPSLQPHLQPTDVPTSTTNTPLASAPASPYTTERQLIQNLTLPTNPNFNIPPSPPPPSPHSNPEEATQLAATTKKFEKFLELKAQGVHFNERLLKSSSLRNPGLLPKLMEFAGITLEDSYASTLGDELGVPVKWPEECYVERLMKQNERRNKEGSRREGRVEFVGGGKEGGESGSAWSAPKEGAAARKTKFDKQ